MQLFSRPVWATFVPWNPVWDFLELFSWLIAVGFKFGGLQFCWVGEVFHVVSASFQLRCNLIGQ